MGKKLLPQINYIKKNNIKLVENAVKGMLPKNKLGAELFRNLKVFPQTDHNYKAQKPKLIDLNAKI